MEEEEEEEGENSHNITPMRDQSVETNSTNRDGDASRVGFGPKGG